MDVSTKPSTRPAPCAGSRPTRFPKTVQQRILDAAIRSPSGGNQQAWRFMLIDDKAVIAAARTDLPAVSRGRSGTSCTRSDSSSRTPIPTSPRTRRRLRVQRSAQWLADHFEEYPLLLASFSQSDPTGGSIHPATWSAMLAARAEGVGSAVDLRHGVRARARPRDPRRARRTKAGSSVRWSPSATRPACGASRHAIPRTKCRTATSGANRSASRSPSRCTRPRSLAPFATPLPAGRAGPTRRGRTTP